MPRHRVFLSAVIFFLAVAASPSALPAALPAASAQYFDGFDGPAAALDPRAWNGWAFYAGDGTVLMDFRQDHGLASVFVDATQDRNNVWWALIRRRVSQALDLTQLADPHYQLRVEARIKTNRAPRRINLHLNTQKTTDFHSHLMEYDIADTSEWHVLSMTTRGFEAYPGDSVYVQLALMDWGLERYRVDVDYVRVDVVDTLASGADLGCPIPYHPKPASPVTFVHHVTVEHDAVIDLQYQDMNFDGWVIREPEGDIPLLSAGGTHYAIMRWNLSGFAGKRVVGSGLLELTTHSRHPELPNDRRCGCGGRTRQGKLDHHPQSGTSAHGGRTHVRHCDQAPRRGLRFFLCIGISGRETRGKAAF